MKYRSKLSGEVLDIEGEWTSVLTFVADDGKAFYVCDDRVYLIGTYARWDGAHWILGASLQHFDNRPMVGELVAS